jgi:hypothetical protein
MSRSRFRCHYCYKMLLRFPLTLLVICSPLLLVSDVWHSEDRASWCIFIMKTNEKHHFSNLFDKVLYMFRTSPMSIIRSISTLYTRDMYLSCYFCCHLLADANRTSTTSTYRVYTVLRYSWWWTLDLSEKCRALYQINLRNSASRWLSL